MLTFGAFFPITPQNYTTSPHPLISCNLAVFPNTTFFLKTKKTAVIFQQAQFISLHNGHAATRFSESHRYPPKNYFMRFNKCHGRLSQPGCFHQ